MADAQQKGIGFANVLGICVGFMFLVFGLTWLSISVFGATDPTARAAQATIGGAMGSALFYGLAIGIVLGLMLRKSQSYGYTKAIVAFVPLFFGAILYSFSKQPRLLPPAPPEIVAATNRMAAFGLGLPEAQIKMNEPCTKQIHPCTQPQFMNIWMQLEQQFQTAVPDSLAASVVGSSDAKTYKDRITFNELARLIAASRKTVGEAQ